MNNEVLLYTDEDGRVNLDVSLKNETVWLSQRQMAELFNKNVKTVNEHIKNVYKEGELEENSTIRNFQTVQLEGKREVQRDINYYNLDVIISVGYRVKSKRGTQFRIWATKILKEYLVKGYAINQKTVQESQLNELTETINLIKNSIEDKELRSDEAKGLLDIINRYAKSWAILQGYDENSLENIVGTEEVRFILDYDEAEAAISELKKELMKKGEATYLFGNEKANEFKGIIRNIYQTFSGIDLIPSLEQKAANLLYYIIKDHAFSDGNKRIGSFIFILFLSKNNLLCKANGELRINDNALVSLALLIATSDPQQKELMVKLVVNLLGE
ncbi:virulence protein RhuM/Fic/DOC family protein [Candidatus Sulfurimonas baltica]|uniref:Virulence protein RhuM/Fic/DOC family protein n=1 Tax=Candidatus Sulfurimonas baltica TaxID=2740404 RepID=A0A7S7LVM2_9BACT|nr:virulence protein RhuM/Fic/DOC family protein [Candidatus Sulfurimonas baltica]QOY52191.1 virulence protein RhuM/Fic/DOC family protein [Candidatus Sulfurimonas baltica]